MRYPLDYMYITNPFKAPGYGTFGVHAGLDLRASIGTNVFAPGAGYVTESYVGSSGIQVLSARIDGKEHRFLHLSQRLLPVGAKFSEGQVIAKTGNSGNVAAHLHWDVRIAGTAWNSSINNYYEPKSTIINTPQGGEEMFKTDAEVKEAYLFLRGNEGSLAERKAWIGVAKQKFFQVGRAEVDMTRKALADVKTALANLQAQPPKTIIKEIEKIVEVPVEKITIKEIEVIKEVEPSWLKTAVDFIRRVLRIKGE